MFWQELKEGQGGEGGGVKDMRKRLDVVNVLMIWHVATVSLVYT